MGDIATGTSVATGSAPEAVKCARCGVLVGDGFVRAAQPNLCSACRQLVNDWPYPQWLKASLVVLLVLLGVALIHGQKYFHAGRTMYQGERLVEEKRYAEALPYLKQTLKIAPRSDKAVLLTAKAALLTGDMETASGAFEGHDGGRFENGKDSEFLEVSAIWHRCVEAMKKAQAAAKLVSEDGHYVEATRMIHEAAAQYPEMPSLRLAQEYYDAGLAFEQKDYDKFLAISEKAWNDHPDAESASGMASALGCKYAVTGDQSYRQRSEQMLQEAIKMAKDNPEELKSLNEFSERNKYRLETRVILTKIEYDKRFRSGSAQATKQ
jgi:tetratricopeptide (TPR) repeat protein